MAYDLTLICETDGGEYYRLVYEVNGLKIAGFFGRPKAPGPHPAVIYNRGGNGAMGALTGTEVVPFVETGFVSAASQYRSGPGSDNAHDDEGGENLRDVTGLVDLLGGLTEVDAERMGMMGFSRGGMMTYLTLKQEGLARDRRIKVAVTHGGVADLFMWGRDRPQIRESVYKRGIGFYPEEAPALFEQRSAVCWPELVDAPLLMLHGEADANVSVEQSRKLYGQLKALGRDVELRTFPEGDHYLRTYSWGFPDAVPWLWERLTGEKIDYEAYRPAINQARASIKEGLKI